MPETPHPLQAALDKLDASLKGKSPEEVQAAHEAIVEEGARDRRVAALLEQHAPQYSTDGMETLAALKEAADENPGVAALLSTLAAHGTKNKGEN